MIFIKDCQGGHEKQKKGIVPRILFYLTYRTESNTTETHFIEFVRLSPGVLLSENTFILYFICRTT